MSSIVEVATAETMSRPTDKEAMVIIRRSVKQEAFTEEDLQSINRYVNCMGFDGTEFSRLYMHQRISIQCKIFYFCLILIKRWSLLDYWDGRNEYTVSKCKILIDKLQSSKIANYHHLNAQFDNPIKHSCLTGR